ncbi:hypothetical protein B0J14DRAFT_696259 [Halenospora varia]|nr:hypothetical protein B0J14DRAFT_696259 [Halenospora varia]
MADPERRFSDNSSAIFVREERAVVISRVFNATMEWEAWPGPRPAIWLNPLCFMNFSAIFYSGDYYDAASAGGPSNLSGLTQLPKCVSAISCSLYYCIRSYNTSVTSGEFKELVQKIPTTHSFDEEKMRWTLQPENCTRQGADVLPPHDNKGTRSHAVRVQTVRSLTQALEDTLISSAYFGSKDYATWSWDLTAAIANLDVLSHTKQKIGNLAQSLSSNLRVNKDICKGIIRGTSWTNRSYIPVNWKIQGMDVWKSPPLPLFFSGLEPEGSQKGGIGGIDDSMLLTGLSLREMGKVSKTMMVKLDEKDGVKVGGDVADVENQ